MKLLDSCEALEVLVSYDKEPVIFLKEWVLFGVHVAASLSIFELKVFNFEFTGQDISDNNLILTLNESSHSELYKRHSFDALFLLLECFVPGFAIDFRG